jgi:hypothetical protein
MSTTVASVLAGSSRSMLKEANCNRYGFGRLSGGFIGN